jgi:hypothetical protein
MSTARRLRMLKRTYPQPGDVRVGNTTVVANPSRTLIRWGAIFGGLVLGLGLLVLLSSLWFALAYGSNITTISSNMRWFIGVSAVASLFIAGILTGYLSGVRGFGTGMLHGFTLWGLLLLVTLTIGIPSILNVFNAGQVSSQVTQATNSVASSTAVTAMWASFWTILGGFIAAGIGGAIGGAFSHGNAALIATDTDSVPKRDTVAEDRPTVRVS